MATQYSVAPDVHSDDLLWQFLTVHPSLPEPTQVADHYFRDGAESARKLGLILMDHLPAAAAGLPYTLLEFASGYGMVTRHLPIALPKAEIVSCDIHSEAVEFIRHRLGSRAILSRHLPEELSLEREYDAVFALSFFSHMPERTFGRWLGALYRGVKPGGILVFTTHGLGTWPIFGSPVIPENGFWFKASSEQGDLDSEEYGSTISTPEFVRGELDRYTGAPILEFRNSYWWGHQDLYVVARRT
jgi:SAM-dependent methyltransferase